MIRASLYDGPLPTYIAVSRKFAFYSSGILKVDKFSYCNTEPNSDHSWAHNMNHAVTIVGWDYDRDRYYNSHQDIPYCEAKEDPDDDCGLVYHQGVAYSQVEWDHGRHCCSTFKQWLIHQSDNDFRVIQNSWGTDWGENGFARVEVSEGVGWCGMNMYAYRIEMEDTLHYWHPLD